LIEKIAIICISPIGDTLFATPAIRALRVNLPQARIVILAGASAFEVLRNNPYQLELVKIINVCDLYKNLSWVREQHFDLALGFSRFGSFFTKMCGATYHADFSAVEYHADRSVVEVCQAVLEVAGQKINRSFNDYLATTEYWLRPRDLRMAEQFLEWSGPLRNQPLVAVHCGGHYFSRKRWPIMRFIELIRHLSREKGYQVVLVGGKEDLSSALAVRMAVPETLSAVGMLRLSETGALLKRCQLYIGNDSGPLHLAAALHVPTVALFGPTQPSQFYPYPTEKHRCLIKEFSCQPCYRLGGAVWQFIPRCTRAYCMEAIDVEEVLNEVESVLKTAMLV